MNSLDDDDDSDDELLLKPSGLLKSPPPATSSTSTASTNVNDPNIINITSPQQNGNHSSNPSAAAAAAVISQEESSSSPFSPQQRRNAMTTEDVVKEAQDVYKCKTIYNEIDSTSLLKWYAKPKQKPKHKKSSSRKRQKHSPEQFESVFPCYVCPNVQQAIAGYEDTVATSPDSRIRSHHGDKTTTLVRFFGYRVSYRDKIQFVPTKHLLPLNYHLDDDGTKNCNNDGKSVDTYTNPTVDDTGVVLSIVGETTSDHSELTKPPQWNAHLMSIYLKSLQKCQQEFKKSLNNNDDVVSDYKLKVEEQLLQIIASSVWEQEQQHPPSKNDTEIDDHDDDDDLPLTSPPKLDMTVTSVSAACTESINSKPPPRPVSTVSKLRAGDVIEYCPPHLIADKLNIIRGTVMECHPREDPAVLVSTGHWLPREHQIRIVQKLRILNAKSQSYQHVDTHPNESYMRISMLKLDASKNGSMDGMVTTHTEQLGKMYKDAVQQISSSVSQHCRDDVNHSDGASSSLDACIKTPQLGETYTDKTDNEMACDTNEDIGSKKRKLRGSLS